MPEAVDMKELTRLYRAHVAWLQGKYEEVLEETGWKEIVIHSGSPKLRSMFDDQSWPLRPVPHFQHWLPLVSEHSALVIDAGKTPELLWNRAIGFWEAPPAPESDHFWSSFDVREIADPDKMKDEMPRGGKKIAFLGEDREDAARWGFGDVQINPPELLERLDRLRTQKTDYERACLAEANRRAAVGHLRVLEAFRKGDASELELHLLYLAATGQDDPETPYKNIVALGEHAATLHHVSYSRRAEGAQSLLLDAGAKFLGYDSDITRTAVKGDTSGAGGTFAALIERIDGLQQEACRRVEVGLNYQALHDQAHQLLAPVLRDLGIAKGSDDELVDRGVTRKFLPHGLGHSLGLQTHDVGCASVKPEPRNPFLRNTCDIESGQCFTIEPGCYFIESLLEELRESPEGKLIDWDLVGELKRFGGVRVEDDLVVGDDGGVENLTREHLPE